MPNYERSHLVSFVWATLHMTAPPPTREDLDELLSRHLGGLFARDVPTERLARAVADLHTALLARLRPAFDARHVPEQILEIDEEGKVHELGECGGCVALRASLARTDEALRACAEAMKYAKERLQVCLKELVHGPGALQSDVHWAIHQIDAALARAQGAGR